ncbi:MAG: hypothetical protein FD155_3276 [Bacteroidetes bacterium]|nr:MAG: hypothetical protein FD155_3276 [Bacteroidota bacterium]
MIDIIQTTTNVLTRLSSLNFEKNGGISSEKLIIPILTKSDGTLLKNKISELEFRHLFTEEFQKLFPHLFYSIETPTLVKFIFGKSPEDFKLDIDGVAAYIDLCIFERKRGIYSRILNIVFKHKNMYLKTIARDIFKLIHEKKDGVYIHMLDNADSGKLCNKKYGSIFTNLYKSFFDFQSHWTDSKKSIQLIIISLKDQTFIERKITRNDLTNLDSIFFVNENYGTLNEVIGQGWQNITWTVKNNCHAKPSKV